MDKVNRIRVQRVEVEFDTPDDAFAIRDRLSEACTRCLIPAMEKLLDAKYGDSPLISIPYLLIDAGVIEEEDWEDALARAMVAELEKQLEKLLSRERGGQSGDPAPVTNGSTAVPAGDRHDPDMDDQDRGGSVIPGMFERNAGFLLYYLEKGSLPWNCPFDRTVQLKDALRHLLDSAAGKASRPAGKQGSASECPGSTNPRFLKDLRVLFVRNGHALKRFLYLLPEERLATVLFSKQWDTQKITKIRKNWDAVFQLAGLAKGDRDPVFFQGVAALRERSTPAPADPLIFAGALAGEIGSVLHRYYKQVFDQLPGIREKHPELLPKISDTPPRNDRWKIPAFVEKSPSAAYFAEPVYINNAGLVLLHPFLSRLFENTGHTLNDQWDSPDLQHRSIVLMAYLVRGNDEYAEPDLFADKLLAGLAPEEPLPLDIQLSEFEKREADELLEAVIGHWKALKNTSIAALRETFLERPGKIERTDNGWLLRVDQKVTDILLNKLPWGFSTIKTPWMKEILNVDWI